MFGVIVAGRPVLTEFQTIDASHVQFIIPTNAHFSHIVVFMLPGNSLPEGSAAAVYVKIPGTTDFRFLGAIANEKQSAIFKVNLASSLSNAATGNDSMIDDTISQTLNHNAQPSQSPVLLGISLEPIATVEAQQAALKRASQQPASPGSQLVLHRPQPQAVPTKLLAQRIIKNAFNFLSSFAGGPGGNESVPLKSFQDWWTKFEHKIALDPSFLERDPEN